MNRMFTVLANMTLAFLVFFVALMFVPLVAYLVMWDSNALFPYHEYKFYVLMARLSAFLAALAGIGVMLENGK